MAKRKRATTEESIRKREKEGRGQGRGADYKPLLQIQDVASIGLATRINGWHTRRNHHFLSKLEFMFFLTLEWSPAVIDIREQFPLDREVTMELAKQLGIKHPADPKTKVPIVMSTDFVVTTSRGDELVDLARCVKYEKDLGSTRVLEKLEIERAYHQIKKTDWGIVTEHEIDPRLTENVKWVHPYRHPDSLQPLSPDMVKRIKKVLTPRVLESQKPLRNITNECDDLLGLEPGSSLLVVRHLIANQVWQIDMTKLVNPPEILILTDEPQNMARRRGRAA
jgi:TnsA endonuclease N terminal/TnsA endonuclease C terminal